MTDGQSKIIEKGLSLAIIVDKEQKRHDIALACRDLLLENGIENLTISQIAQTAGVGKGTIYEYFENKEDIVFEIISTFLYQYQQQLKELIVSPLDVRQKLFIFCNKLYESKEGLRHLDLYHEFIGILLIKKEPQMLEFNTKARGEFVEILQQIIDQGIDRGEIDKSLTDVAELIVTFLGGLMIDSIQNSFDVIAQINKLLDFIFTIEGKGDS